MPLFTILYVADPTASAAFYTALLGVPPVEAAPTFAMFALPDGHMLGLWGEAGVLPQTTGTGARSELAFDVTDHAALVDLHAKWTAAGAVTLQEIVELDFGETFTVADPDGHRLRAMVPKMG